MPTGKDPKEKSNTPPISKLKYRKPSIVSESLTAVAALCNGTATGGRKATTGAPNFCNASKLKS